MHPNPITPLILRSYFLRLLCLFAAQSCWIFSADDNVIAAVRAADDERVAAMLAADRARMEAVYADDLHYGHSNARIDTKASFIDPIAKGTLVYQTYDYKERKFRLIAPGVVQMTGRVLNTATRGEQKVENDLVYLAVWREEAGQWRFVAWQSCKVPPPAPAAPPPARPPAPLAPK